jgi:hypothetical protein
MVLLLLLAAGIAAAQSRHGPARQTTTDPNAYAEFAFTRLIFESGLQHLPGPGNTAWRDWPESDMHLIGGIRRLTGIDVEDRSRAHWAFEEQIFDQPWIYAVEVGSWLLAQEDADNLREYLLRGGFLVIDDFHGTVQWRGFMQSMRKIFPDRPIVEVTENDVIMNMHFDLDHSKPIPGIMALRKGVTYEHDGFTPTWRGIYDDEGRLMVIINHNVDLGDAWEMADMPWYPEEYTAAAYRYGVNYILYAMTH